MADPLERYRAKRDFGKTAEPPGDKAASSKSRLRFVIQKHAATRLHYDLRLEHEGVFLSWAVTRGPSLDPEEKRLAVEVEPHPLDYGDFEGTIPKGQYGGGTVMLWDRGWWEPEPGLTVEKALKKGHLVARFEGERMRGAWHLVLIRNDRGAGKRRNWLFFKAHDGRERPGDGDAFLDSTAASIASGRTMEAIAAGEGPPPKPFVDSAVKTPRNAVWTPKPDRTPDGAVAAKPTREPRKASAAPPDWVAPQRASLVDRPPADGDWAHEIKFDGYRMQLRVHQGRATLKTRTGHDWTDRFPDVERDGARLPDGLYDGELCALDDDERPSFAALQAALSDGRGGALVLFLFDALWLNGGDLRGSPLRDRKARLKRALSRAPSARLRYVDHFETAGGAVLRSACRMELEGVVSKRLDSPYRSGRTDTWLKSKCRGGQEVVVGGWATTGGAKFRSLLVGVRREDGSLRYAGRVGTGFSGETVERILPRLQAAEANASPFSGPGSPRKIADVHWLRPDLVAEIAFAGWTADGAVRQASFKGLRDDKPAKDVVAESALEQAPTPRSVPRRNVVLGVTISNPDKTLWPATKAEREVSKLDLALYLEAVADRILPYLRGRPCSIVRTPEGVDGGQRFFQRHAGAGTSSLVALAPVRGDKKPYLQIDTPEALIAVAQSGATELHPWNCAPFQPETPGRLVFDLDPDEAIPFERVIEAAREIRDRLKRFGLEAFLKTTGGKGLHVVTPLLQPEQAVVQWPEAKAFAKRLCDEAAADSPTRYTTNMSKKQRPGRIFLDYLRNDRLSTAAALLSPRARPGATVSFPLRWGQARAGLDPQRYTIRTAVTALRRGDPWDGYDSAAAPLADAIRTAGPGPRTPRTAAGLRSAPP